MTRRNLLLAGAAAGVAPLLTPSLAAAQSTGELQLLPVPEALPEKVYTTERVGISRDTHDEHLKLFQGYARKTNEIRTLLRDVDPDPAKASQIYSPMRALKSDYPFALGGYLNHLIFFDTIGGVGGPATGRVAELIAKSYGSFEAWAAEWKSTGIASRGWVFLGYSPEEDLVFNFLGDAQDTYPQWNHRLILAMDVYEHAYYLDFKSARARYIDAYMQVIDWDAVNARLEA